MNRVKLRHLLRWVLTILLGAGSCFFLFSGFSAALLGDGAEPGELRRAWSHHAEFLLSIAMLLWLGSVAIFMSLRSGGFLKVVRGEQINSIKRWFYITSLIAALAAFLLSNPIVLLTQLTIHRCQKAGANWNFVAKRCEFRK